MLDYKELIEDVKEIHSRFTIVGGFLDIYTDHTFVNGFIKEFDTYWIYIGNINEDELKESFIEHEYNIEKKPGCYQFEAVLKYEKPEYGDYGRVIAGGYWYIDYIDLKLDHTFEQRERDFKLNELLSGDLGDIFNI